MMHELELLAFVLFAALLGAVIGFERELKQKPAGLKTHALMAASSALLVALGPALIKLYKEDQPIEVLRVEPLAVLQAIIVAVGFLAGGAVLKDAKRERIENLTTAATILLSATIGILVAVELFYLSVGVTLAYLGLNTLFRRLEERMGTYENEECAR